MATTSSPDPGDRDSATAHVTDSADVRDSLRADIRKRREALKLTQARLGSQVGVSRFTINRIEAGVADLTPVIAEQLEHALDLTDLRSRVAMRDRLVSRGDGGRDVVVQRMLNRTDLIRLRIVIADQLNVYQLVHSWLGGDSVIKSQDVEIVVPSVRRERELFGSRGLLHGHVEYQIKRLLDLKKSQRYVSGSLRLYESDDVLAAVVIAETAAGTEAVTWPPLTVRDERADADAALLPVGSTTEPRVVGRIQAHVDSLIAGRESLRSNEALCQLDPAGEATQPAFTRYFTVGEDQEEDVDDSEGVAMALILVVALCPRRSYGVDRRVVTYMRASARLDRRRSLFSNTVEDIDLQRARAVEEGAPISESRSTRVALPAALDINSFLERQSRIIPDAAYRFAASREMSMFDIDIDPERFEVVPTPPELRLVRKPVGAGGRRAAIAPKLLLLELNSDSPEPELAAIQAKANVEEVGIRDIVEDDALNDFLVEARASGFLDEILQKLRIAQR